MKITNWTPKKHNDAIERQIHRIMDPMDRAVTMLGRNHKSMLNADLGVITATLTMSPAWEAVYHVHPSTAELIKIVLSNGWAGKRACQWATKLCIIACLKNSGRQVMPTHMIKRQALSIWAHNDPKDFQAQLDLAIDRHIAYVARKAHREGANLQASFRFGITSEEIQRSIRNARRHPRARWNEYTKGLSYVDRRWEDLPGNITIAGSLSDANHDEWIQWVRKGRIGAAVFHLTKTQVKSGAHPKTYHGIRVVDGVSDDLLSAQRVGSGGVIRALALLGTHDAKNGALDINPDTGRSFAITPRARALRLIA